MRNLLQIYSVKSFPNNGIVVSKKNSYSPNLLGHTNIVHPPNLHPIPPKLPPPPKLFHLRPLSNLHPLTNPPLPIHNRTPRLETNLQQILPPTPLPYHPFLPHHPPHHLLRSPLPRHYNPLLGNLNRKLHSNAPAHKTTRRNHRGNGKVTGNERYE